jgi:hypothetical protein
MAQKRILVNINEKTRSALSQAPSGLRERGRSHFFIKYIL